MGRLEHRVAVITGAGSGIGLETSLLAAREGARVVAADINLETAQKTVELIHSAFGTDAAIAIKADVSKESEVEAMVKAAVDKYGRLDIMFNNVFRLFTQEAGIMHPSDDDAINTSDKIFDLTYQINVKGVWYGCKHAIIAMRNNPSDPAKGLTKGGSIINTASFVGMMGAATPQLAYTASKGAVLAITRELAAVHAREGIRVNNLCPGPLRTRELLHYRFHRLLVLLKEFIKALLMDFLDTPEKKERRLVHVPMGRFGEAIEQAQAVLFLASKESSYITGMDMKVDGGLTSAYVTPLGEPQVGPPQNLSLNFGVDVRKPTA